MVAQRSPKLHDLPAALAFENEVPLVVIGVGVYAGTNEPLRNAMRKRVLS
jgi:hypothetical protein